MTREVRVLPRAASQIDDATLWWSEHRSTLEAARWLSGIESAIQNLANDAERFPLAAESSEFDFDLRQMNFGVSRRPTHRVLFAIRNDRVVVYAVRHLAQRDVSPNDL